MKKHGKKANAVTWLLGILVVFVVAASSFGIYYLVKHPAEGTAFTQQTGVPSTSQNQGGAIQINTVNPTVSFTATDRQASGTTISVSANASINGQSWDTVPATLVPGQLASFLIHGPKTVGGAYHNAYIGPAIAGSENVISFLGNPVGPIAIKAETFPIAVKLNQNSTVTEVMYYAYGNTNLNNGAGANNISGTASLKAYTIEDRMYGEALKSTQDLRCLYELTLGVNASSTPQGVVVNGPGVTFVGTSTPAYYTMAGADSRVWIYDMPAISDSSAHATTITVTEATNKKIGTGAQLIKTCYTKEFFKDPNAVGGADTIKYDVADSNNAIKSIAKYTFTGIFST